MLPEPDQSFGISLRSSEYTSLRGLSDVLGPLIDELGDVRDDEYIAHERWPQVVEAARVALEATRS